MLRSISLTWLRPFASRAWSLVRHRFNEIAWRRISTGLRDAVIAHAPAAAGVSGLFLARREQRERLLAAGAVFAMLLGVAVVELSTRVAVTCFVVALAARFTFLFASFTPNGIAARLKARFGMERGQLLHASALESLLLAQRLAFLALLVTTAQTAASAFGAALIALGLLLALVGASMSVGAAHAAGLESLHYRDLFVGRRSSGLVKIGPYARWANPMYGVGQLVGYGLALMALSPIALLAAGLNQALLFAFNELVERPALRSADKIFLETQSRYELARTLLGFDPRPELARRTHSAPANSIQPNEPAAL